MHNDNSSNLFKNSSKRKFYLQPNKEDLSHLIKLFSTGSFKKALTHANALLEIFPNSSILYNIRGAINAQLKDMTLAINDYDIALKISPNFVEAYNNIGVAFQNTGQDELAISSYKNAIKINPDYANSYFNLASLYKDKGNLDHALEYYRQTIQIKPDYADAHNNLAGILKDKHCLEEAFQHYKMCLEINPKHINANLNLAIMFYESKRYKEACKLFKLDNSSKSQNFLLRCLFDQEDILNFEKQLDYMISNSVCNSVIGSLISRSKIKYKINKNNPYCNEPLKYVYKKNLKDNYNFDEIFVKSAKEIFDNEKVQFKAQTHLTNGVQTAGNIFKQGGVVTKKIERIIRVELENYRKNFIDSNEGFITNWPKNYNVYGWLVSIKNGGELAPHMHDVGWITGSIYIKVPPRKKNDSGNLVVCLDKTNEQNHKKSIKVVTGNLCFFPSSLLHYTVPFESNEDRIVLAFDVIPME